MERFYGKTLLYDYFGREKRRFWAIFIKILKNDPVLALYIIYRITGFPRAVQNFGRIREVDLTFLTCRIDLR